MRVYYYYFRNNPFNKNSCVSSPLPRILGSPPSFNNLGNKNDLRPGQLFSCLSSLRLRLSLPQEGGAWRRWGAAAGVPAARRSGPQLLLGGKDARVPTALLRGRGKAPVRGSNWRGAQGSPIFPPPPGLGVSAGSRGLGVECSRQSEDAGGQGASVSGTLELGRRKVEGGVPTSRPVPLLAKGAESRRGDAKGKWQPNGASFNQHPLVLPTGH